MQYILTLLCQIKLSYHNVNKYSMDIFIKQVFIFIGLILGLILIFEILGFKMNLPPIEKKVSHVVMIEPMENNNNSMIIKHMLEDHDLDLSEIEDMTNPQKSFCNNYQGSRFSELEPACNNLSKNSCNSTDCCVYLNNNKCVSGSSDGPTYRTDKEGKDIIVDNYYHMNKCVGKCN